MRSLNRHLSDFYYFCLLLPGELYHGLFPWICLARAFTGLCLTAFVEPLLSLSSNLSTTPLPLKQCLGLSWRTRFIWLLPFNYRLAALPASHPQLMLSSFSHSCCMPCDLLPFKLSFTFHHHHFDRHDGGVIRQGPNASDLRKALQW